MKITAIFKFTFAAITFFGATAAMAETQFPVVIRFNPLPNSPRDSEFGQAQFRSIVEDALRQRGVKTSFVQSPQKTSGMWLQYSANYIYFPQLNVRVLSLVSGVRNSQGHELCSMELGYWHEGPSTLPNLQSSLKSHVQTMLRQCLSM